VVSDDLAEPPLREAMPERALRSYPALLSTEAEATAWARAGAPAGALVTAGYQVSPRGRAGQPWRVELGRGLGFSVVLRPSLAVEREGWPYVTTALGLSDVLGGDGTNVHWPDRVEDADGGELAALGLTVQLGPAGTDWVVATVLVDDADPPRAPLLARAVGAVERRLARPAEETLEDYRSRCATLGRRVLARMIPLGPAGPRLTGIAVDVLADGALVLLTERGHRVAVRPQNLGVLEPAEHP
jgi:BirA family biotin operon repressor/biotin-[acetyl-CoA-carboxylase] ligase